MIITQGIPEAFIKYLQNYNRNILQLLIKTNLSELSFTLMIIYKVK